MESLLTKTFRFIDEFTHIVILICMDSFSLRLWFPFSGNWGFWLWILCGRWGFCPWNEWGWRFYLWNEWGGRRFWPWTSTCQKSLCLSLNTSGVHCDRCIIILQEAVVRQFPGMLKCYMVQIIKSTEIYYNTQVCHIENCHYCWHTQHIAFWKCFKYYFSNFK